MLWWLVVVVVVVVFVVVVVAVVVDDDDDDDDVANVSILWFGIILFDVYFNIHQFINSFTYKQIIYKHYESINYISCLVPTKRHLHHWRSHFRPHQHGADVLPSLSHIITHHTSDTQSPAVALLLDALYTLCQTEVCMRHSPRIIVGGKTHLGSIV